MLKHSPFPPEGKKDIKPQITIYICCHLSNTGSIASYSIVFILNSKLVYVSVDDPSSGLASKKKKRGVFLNLQDLVLLFCSTFYRLLTVRSLGNSVTSKLFSANMRGMKLDFLEGVEFFVCF